MEWEGVSIIQLKLPWGFRIMNKKTGSCLLDFFLTLLKIEYITVYLI